jgi:hypothetical protein
MFSNLLGQPVDHPLPSALECFLHQTPSQQQQALQQGPYLRYGTPAASAGDMLRVLKPEDTQQALLLAARTFVEHEPMTKATGKSLDDMLELFGPITAACCSSGMSFGVGEQDGSGAIVCVSLALPYPAFKAVRWPEVPRPAQAILSTLPKVPPEQEAVSVYMFVWATLPNHMGKGYTKAAAAASIDAARQAGYSSLVADLTNVVSQHLGLSHFGFTPMEPKARYHDFEGFRVVQCSEYLIRAVKDLTAEAAAADGAAAPAAAAAGS